MTRKVVDVAKSPMNPRVKLVRLDCGHELFTAQRVRIGSKVPCEKCPKEEP